MKLTVFVTFLAVSNAFTPVQRPSLSRSAPRLNALATATGARECLVNVANRIKSEQGVFVYDSKAKADLTEAVKELEAVASPPSRDDYETMFNGNWELVCTTSATDKTGIDLSKLPFLNEGPIKNVRESLNRRVRVVQKIVGSPVDRVDHVIEYMPPADLDDVFGDVPEALKMLSLNPLELTKSKVSLVHKAQVESVVPKLTTKLSLESVVLNVAGKSQFLDPAGADVLGINVPLGEFLQAGSFDTTYMDDDLRVSRSKVGPIDQLRVFRRVNPKVEEEQQQEWIQEDLEDSADFPSDVEWVGEDEGSDASDSGAEEVVDVADDAADDATPADDVETEAEDDYPSDVEL